MTSNRSFLAAVFVACVAFVAMAGEPAAPAKAGYDPELATKLGADERGMRMYVLCILKTGPKDAEIKGKERSATRTRSS